MSKPDADGERRIALVLAVLRLSRDAELRPRLEAALVALDDRRRPWAEPPDEAVLLYRARERLRDTLDPAAHTAWTMRRLDEGGPYPPVDAELAALNGPGLPQPASPRSDEAAGAAGELLARTRAGGGAEPGTTTSAGWTVVARLDIGGMSAWGPTELWALLPPDGGAIGFVATGNDVQEHCSWEHVRKGLEIRRREAAAAEAFVRAAEQADPALRAERRADFDSFFRELHERRVGRESTQRHGETLLHLYDGQPVRAEGALLVGTSDEVVGRGIEALRIDTGQLGAFTEAPPTRPWSRQVWARPLGGGVWRRGRLRPGIGGVVFRDEPAASGPERGDGALLGREPDRSLERDLVASAAVRSKAAASDAYARLLYAALENATWRHADGARYEGGQRSTGDLVSTVVGAGAYIDWLWSSPTGLLDEEVLTDLQALGWEPVDGGWSRPRRHGAREP